MDRKQPDADAKRDAVLRRMLATPKPGKGDKERGEAKPAGSERRGRVRLQAKSSR